MRHALQSLLMVLFFGGVLHAQDRSDSLDLQLEGLVGAQRAAKLVQFVEELHSQDPSRAIAYATEAEAILREHRDRQLLTDLLYWKGMAFYIASEYDSALVYSNRTLQLALSESDARAASDAKYIRYRVAIRRGDYEQALAGLKDLATEYQRLNADVGLGDTYNAIGTVYWHLADYEKSLDAYQQALEIRRRLDDMKGVSACYNNIALVYHHLGDYQDALEMYQKSLVIKEDIGDTWGTALALGNAGLVYGNLGEYDKALSYYMRGLKIAEEMGYRRSIGIALNNIGNIYRQLDDKEKALEFLNRSLAIKEELGDKNGIAITLDNVGEIHASEGRVDLAFEMYERALTIYREIKDKNGIGNTLLNIGGLHIDLGNLAEAETAFENSLRVFKEIGDKEGIAGALGSRGKLYIKDGRYNRATPLLNQALQIAKEIGHKQLIRSQYEQLSLAFEEQERFREALAAYKKFKAANDSLFNSESQTIVSELQERYRTKEQQQRIALLQQKNKVQSLWTAVLAGGSIMLALLAFLLYSRYRFRTRAHRDLSEAHEARRREAEVVTQQNNELQEKNEELDRLLMELKATQTQLIHSEKIAAMGKLVSGIMHEMNTPLGAINSATDMINRALGNIATAMQENADEDRLVETAGFSNALKVLQDNTPVTKEAAQRISRIITGLRSFVALDESNYQLADIHKGLDSTFDLLEYDFRGRVKLIKEYGDIPKIRCYPGELNQVFLHLLSNASQAIQSDGTIRVRTLRDNSTIRIEISDSGVGIAAEQMAEIFNPSFSMKGTRVKAGLGLFTCLSIIQKHNGKINVDSEVGKGSTFTVILPTD